MRFALRSSLATLALALPLSLALGCGGGDDEASPAATTTASGAGGGDTTTTSTGGAGGQGGSTDPGVVGVVRGRVLLYGRDDHAGVVVSVPGTSLHAATDAAGRFEITGVPVGAREVVASFAEYASTTVPEVKVEAAAPVEVPAFTLYRGRLLAKGEDAVPVALTEDRALAVFATGFTPYTMVGDLHAWDVAAGKEVATAKGAFMPSVLTTKRFVLYASNYVQSGGTGDLHAYDRTTGKDVPLGNGAAGPGVRVSPDGEVVAILSGFDAMKGTGALSIWRAGDAAPTKLADGVSAGLIGFRPDSGLLMFGSEVDPVTNAGALHLYDLAAKKDEVVDPAAAIYSVQLDPAWTSIVFLSGPKPNADLATLRVHRPADHVTVTIGANTPADAVHVSKGFDRVIAVTDLDPLTNAGTLRTWSVGDAAPAVRGENVDRSLVASEDGSKVLFREDLVVETYTSRAGVWDDDTGEIVDLGEGVSNVQLSPVGNAVAWLSGFDDATQAGELRLRRFDQPASIVLSAEGSRNLLSFSPHGERFVFMASPVPDPNAYEGEVWAHDVSTAQSALLGAKGNPVVEWSSDGRLLTFHTDFDEKALTSRLWVHSFTAKKTASLGVCPHANFLSKFAPFGDRLAFFRTYGIMSGDLWLWDADAHGWDGDALGTPLDAAVGEYSVRFDPGGDHLVYVANMPEGTDTGDLRHYTLATGDVKDVIEGVASSTLNFAPTGPTFLVYRGLAWPTADLVRGRIDTGATEVVAEHANLQGLWLDAGWQHGLVLADATGDLGTLRALDFGAGTKSDLGKGVPFFGMRVAPSGERVGFLGAFDAAASRGALAWGDLVGMGPAIPIEPNAPITYLAFDRDLVYAVKGPGDEPLHPNGVYLAAALP